MVRNRLISNRGTGANLQLRGPSVKAFLINGWNTFLANEKGVTVADLKKFHDTFFRSNNAFLILAGGLEHDPVLRESLALEETEEAELMASCREEIPAAVQDAYDYWLEQRRPQTVRRETPKIGRNDPCICGSGKKFKQCCGAPHTEH